MYKRLRTDHLLAIPLRIRNDVDILAGITLRNLVRTGAYDVVHFHTARAHALSPWLYGLGSKRVVTRRMDYPLRKNWLTRWLYAQSVDKVIAISLGVQAALLAGGVPLERIRVISSGIDTARFAPRSAARHRIRAEYGIDPQTPLIVSLGALVDRKGHDLLLTAAHRLKSQGSTLRYLIGGEGPLRPQLEDHVRSLGLTQELQFIGFYADVSGLLSAADIFVHVPSYEGLGVAVIEALAAGCPVIASHVGGIPELIEDGKTGMLIPPQDPEALVKAMITLLKNRPFAQELGSAGKGVVRTCFDVNIMAKANEALYVELLADTS